MLLDLLLAAISIGPLSNLSSTSPADPCRDFVLAQNPHVQWTSERRLTADLTFDGSPEFALWGVAGDTTVLVIVDCKGGTPGRSWRFPFRFQAICGSAHVDAELENPAFGEGYLLEQCLGAEKSPECVELAALDKRLQAGHEAGGWGLRLGIPDCDGVHLYWDEKAEDFRTWRF
jgi:hypothetical protein